MPSHRHLTYVFAFAAVFTGSAKAHSTEEQIPTAAPVFEVEPAPQISTLWLDQLWSLPIFRFFVPSLPGLPVETVSMPPCLVSPLPDLEDLEALAFEAGPTVININGLTPRTAVALGRFDRLVTRAGGSLILTSAYRPAAYQDHLQAVWDKWMLELRGNFDEGCAELKASVQNEFLRHQLRESQRPATVSDHTRGISFDASVLVPRGKRSLSVDVLARRAGFHRPVRRSDPVHFRLIAGV